MSTDATTLPTDALPPVIHPWEDFETILRHAKKAYSADDKMRAMALFARVIDLNPNDPRGWTGYASSTPNRDEAIVGWGYALALLPDDKQARSELEALIEEKIEASQKSQDHLALAASFVTLGRALAEAGQHIWAYRLLVRATQLDQSNEHTWIWRAGVTEDLQETITCLEQALKINPHSARAKAGLRWAQTRQGAMPVSRTAVERAAQWLDDAMRALQEGDNEHAYELLRNSTELDPRNALAWFWRGSVTLDVDEALACMEQSLALNPKSEAARDAIWWMRIRKLRERARAQAQVFATSASASFPRVAKPTPMPVETRLVPIPNWILATGGVLVVFLIVLLFLLFAR